MSEEILLALDWLFSSESYPEGLIHQITDGDLEIVAIKFNGQVQILIADKHRSKIILYPWQTTG